MVWAVDNQSARPLFHSINFNGTTWPKASCRAMLMVVDRGKSYRFEPPSARKLVNRIRSYGLSRKRDLRGPGRRKPSRAASGERGWATWRRGIRQRWGKGKEWDDEEEKREMRLTAAAFHEAREWLGCLGKSDSLSGSSLDRPRSYPALHSFGHPTSSLCPLLYPLTSSSHPLSLRPFCVLPPKLHIAKMGAIPEVDPDEPVETKPFKFVTGKSPTPSPDNEAQLSKVGVNG